jgi:hypothetical protein
VLYERKEGDESGSVRTQTIRDAYGKGKPTLPATHASNTRPTVTNPITASSGEVLDNITSSICCTRPLAIFEMNEC